MTQTALVAAVERMQDELGCLCRELDKPHAPLSMGERAQAIQTISAVDACLGNLKRTLTRGEEAHG